MDSSAKNTHFGPPKEHNLSSKMKSSDILWKISLLNKRPIGPPKVDHLSSKMKSSNLLYEVSLVSILDFKKNLNEINCILYHWGVTNVTQFHANNSKNKFTFCVYFCFSLQQLQRKVELFIIIQSKMFCTHRSLNFVDCFTRFCFHFFLFFVVVQF